MRWLEGVRHGSPAIYEEYGAISFAAFRKRYSQGDIVGGWAHGHASNSRFYWKPDLYEMGERMARLEQDISEGKPGAQERLKSFRAERILMVDSIIQVCFHFTHRSRSIDRAPNQGSVEFEEWAKLEAEAQLLETDKRRTQRQKA
jgi:hypothetical protein